MNIASDVILDKVTSVIIAGELGLTLKIKSLRIQNLSLVEE